MNRLPVAIRPLSVLALTSGVARAEPPAPPPPTVDRETIVIVDRAPEGAARDRDRALGERRSSPCSTPTSTRRRRRSPMRSRPRPACRPGASAGSARTSRSACAARRPGTPRCSIDGVPLARIAAVTTDLGRYALDAFGEVELYRGAVPVELGGAGVGGAVNLVTRLGRGERGERVRASMGVGSFGARHLRGALRRRSRPRAVGDDDRLPGRDRRLHVLRRQRHAAQPDRRRLSRPRQQRVRSGRCGDPARRGGAGARRWRAPDLEAAGAAGQHGGAGPGGASCRPSTRWSTRRATPRSGARSRASSATSSSSTRASRDPAGELGLGAADRANATLSAGASSTWRLPVGAHRLAAGARAARRWVPRSRSRRASSRR